MPFTKLHRSLLGALSCGSSMRRCCSPRAIKMRDLFEAADNDKPLIEQPAREQAIVGLEGMSRFRGEKTFVIEREG